MFEKFLNRKAKIVADTNPDKIFVENIRSFFNTSTREAKRICDIAVEEGVMKRKFAVRCKNKNCERIIQVFDSVEEIPETVYCRTCDIDGEEKSTFQTTELIIDEYFQYIDK